MNRTVVFSIVTTLAVITLCSGCATPYSDRHVAYTMQQAMISAQELAKADKKPEAVKILDAMSEVDKNYPGLKELRQTCSPDDTNTTKHAWLGENVRNRADIDRSIPAKILLFLPDRIFDILDIVSFDLNFGGGVFVDTHLTRAVQFNAGVRSVGGIGWHDNRSLGVEAQKEAGLNILTFGATAYSAARAGTAGIQSVSDSIAGFHGPSDVLYQEYRDYWGVGMSASALFIGVDVEFHPIHVADLFAGFIGCDFCNDDYSHTRGLTFNSLDQQILMDLAKIAKFKE